MKKQLVIDNLRFAKRSAKRVPDQLRAASGYLTRAFSGSTFAEPLGVAQPVQFRDFGGGRFPTRVVTPGRGHFMTTFFDVEPLSPSKRYLAVTQVPFINRIPIPGDLARIGYIDLDEQIFVPVYETKGWGAQLGANVQWGNDDNTIFCNDFVDGKGVGVRISIADGISTILQGPVYGMSPDRKHSYGPDLELVNAIMPGYGVPDPVLNKRRQHVKISATEGIWLTNLSDGSSSLLASLADIVPALTQQETVAGGRYYVFNVKVSPLGDRLLAVLFSRQVPNRVGWPMQLITMRLDGSDAQVAMPDALWRVGGHHANWMPDGEHILMNLKLKGQPMAFVKFRYDGSGLEVVAPGHLGSGHPSIHPTKSFLMTDAYVSEGFKDENHQVPIRLIDLKRNSETEIARLYTKNLDGARRIDPHPVWSGRGDFAVFNALIDGYRQVLLADMTAL